MLNVLTINQNRSPELLNAWLNQLRSVKKLLDLKMQLFLVDYGSTFDYQWKKYPDLKVIKVLNKEDSKALLQWNRSAAINTGLRAIDRKYPILISDLDLLLPAELFVQIGKVLALTTAEKDQLYLTNKQIYKLDQTLEQLKVYLKTNTFWGNCQYFRPRNLKTTGGGGLIFGSFEFFASMGGFDENYIGWGAEDSDFFARCSQLKKLQYDVNAPIAHLYHPPPELDQELYQANQARYKERLAGKLEQLTPWEI